MQKKLDAGDVQSVARVKKQIAEKKIISARELLEWSACESFDIFHLISSPKGFSFPKIAIGGSHGNFWRFIICAIVLPKNNENKPKKSLHGLKNCWVVVFYFAAERKWSDPYLMYSCLTYRWLSTSQVSGANRWICIDRPRH